jgi:cell division protein FtsI (penicillin-binding protein 3)
VNRPYNEVLQDLADRKRGFVYLARKLDPSVEAKVKALHVAGIGTMTEPKRLYPQNTLAAQLLGSVGTDNWGLAGLEQLREKSLHGSDGKERIVKDGAGQPISIVEDKRSEAGKDMRLTIDSVIQQKAEDVLAGVGQTYRPKGATAVVMDPRNGEVLALANWPAVNANELGSSPAYARQDRAVSVNYEPGSTFKAVTVSGALQEKLITPATSFDLPPTLQVADRTIKEAHDRGYETLSTGQILAQSSNIGAVKIGLMLGKQRFDHWVRAFGFGKGTGVDIPGEQAGIVPKPANYSGSSLGNLPIGQGIAVTPMQMAAAYEAIADGGVVHRPHVIMGDPAPAQRVISSKVANQVSHMLEGVLGPGGTAPEAKVAGYTLAGKTGTAQKPDGMGGYSKFKFVASFIGYAPARDPRLLVAVMVDEPQGDIYGGTVAAPAFEKIVSFALPYLKIPPN